MKKSEVIKKKVIFSLRWSVDITFYIFTCENIKYTLYFINIFLYFTTLYIMNSDFYGCKNDNFISEVVKNISLLLIQKHRL